MNDIRLKIVIINSALFKYETSTTGIILEVKVVFHLVIATRVGIEVICRE